MLRRASSQTWEWAPACPDEHQIAAYADATIPESARENVELHLADCERCTLLVGTLSRLEIESTDRPPTEVLAQAERLVRLKTGRWTRYLPHLAAAAVLVLAVGVFFGQRDQTTVRTEDNFRTTRSMAAPPRMEVLVPSAGAGVHATDFEVRWTGIPDTRYYLVRIVTGSGALVTEQRVTDTHWKPGSGVELQAGQDYYVRVEAYPSVGASTGSVHVPFTVRDDR
ncbi:MAG TPA: zf-HC2 domain-containing protein [Steroidobacteraceae bacterium]|nr:zf-HC2 domain-containing protein [Steroidobacteraceae bacterium]